MESHRIVSRETIGKHCMCLQKEIEIEIDVARNIGKMQRLLKMGNVDESDISNEEEINVFINVDNGRTLRFSGTE